jgi:outer membrane protein OmpA-like peptidoglycan-associated protein
MKHILSYDGYRLTEGSETATSEAGVEVNAWNRKHAQVFKFENDASDAIEDAYAAKATEAIASLIKLLKRYPSIRIDIVAHTSSPKAGAKWNGSNERLSMARAEYIKALVVKGGVSPDNITSVGKGASEPLAQNDTSGSQQETARKQLMNRRAEVVLSKVQPESITEETLTMTQTLFVADTIVPTTLPNAKSVAQEYRIYNPEMGAGDAYRDRRFYAETAEEVISKVEKADLNEIQPSADSELVTKLRKIGEYYINNLHGKGITIRMCGFSVAKTEGYAQILAAARATYMKRVMMSLYPAIKPEMISTEGQKVTGGHDKIMAKVEFVDENGKPHTV